MLQMNKLHFTWCQWKLLLSWVKCVQGLRCVHLSAVDRGAPHFDVIVVGGGHAGSEACTAACRMGARTLLVTHKKTTIGEMSCNPSFGGIGKGHLMKEVDALDGICGRICDLSGIHYKVLNKRKGPAVWGPRAQIDRSLYKKYMQMELLENTPNLQVIEASVEDLIVIEAVNKDAVKRECTGIILADGTNIAAKTVILTTGTFLKGQINIGLEVRPAGRIGDEPAIGLAKTLEKLNFRMGRLKTGTPPRLDGRTIDYNVCIPQIGDNPPQPFSFLNNSVWIKPEEQLACYLTFTTPEINKIVLDNMHVNRHVAEEITGPRYCPSIESKVLRFGNRAQQIWLEPEGFDNHIVYPNGLSCTLPEDLQVQLVRKVKGLEKAEVVRPGYGVEYDFVDPRELNPTLETCKIKNLFFAGQINGTTGYEEAAAQGIVAAINAALKVQERPGFILSRTESYTGVLIDDLTTLGTNEPYRMFTSRAEFRLSLRPDNADLRLTEKGWKVGCVSTERYERMCRVKHDVEKAKNVLMSHVLPISEWRDKLKLLQSKASKPISAYGLLSLPDEIVTVKKLASAFPNVFGSIAKHEDICLRLQIESLYEDAIAEQMEEIEEVKKDEALYIPDDLDYAQANLNLSTEEKEKLMATRPQTIAAASRIPGVNPSSVFRLLRYVKQYEARRREVPVA